MTAGFTRAVLSMEFLQLGFLRILTSLKKMKNKKGFKKKRVVGLRGKARELKKKKKKK
uniref:Uncharacterized protein n=1 Tax=Anguilla anguilla TaxID=7936 RepID=A0A0E9X0Q8_ANGAN